MRPTPTSNWSIGWRVRTTASTSPDVARRRPFCGSEGFEYDRPLPDAWRFRDYVIDSFNRDKPLDRFLTEQLAGDELAPGNRELETAAVFHRLGAVRRNAGNQDVAASRNEVLIERTDIIGTAILGLTVGCALSRPQVGSDPPEGLLPPAGLSRRHAGARHLLASEEEKKLWETKTKAVNDQLRKLRRVSMTVVGAEKPRSRRRSRRSNTTCRRRRPPFPGS